MLAEMIAGTLNGNQVDGVNISLVIEISKF
jgi:hypothetical protein